MTIRSNNPRIDVEALRKRVAEELENPSSSTKLALETHLQTIEEALRLAEERSVPRTAWPENLDVFPFSMSASLRSLALRVLALATRDQQEVNAALIRSQRETLALVRDLLALLRDESAE